MIKVNKLIIIHISAITRCDMGSYGVKRPMPNLIVYMYLLLSITYYRII